MNRPVEPLSAEGARLALHDLRVAGWSDEFIARLEATIALAQPEDTRTADPGGLREALEDFRHSITTNLRVSERNMTGATDYYAGKVAAFKVVLGNLDDRLAALTPEATAPEDVTDG